LKLYIFAQHVAGWIPSGDWKIVQVDDSTSLSFDETLSITTVLGENYVSPKLTSIRRTTFLAKFDLGVEKKLVTELRLFNLIHLLLLFKCHAEFVSSGCNAGQFLSIQDGFVYFMGGEEKSMVNDCDINEFENEPTRSPKWIRDLNFQYEEN
jgi:hypothetical protein